MYIYKYFTLEVLHDSMSTLYNFGLRPSLLFLAHLQIMLANRAKKSIASPEEVATFVANYQ